MCQFVGRYISSLADMSVFWQTSGSVGDLVTRPETSYSDAVAVGRAGADRGPHRSSIIIRIIYARRPPRIGPSHVH